MIPLSDRLLRSFERVELPQVEFLEPHVAVRTAWQDATDIVTAVIDLQVTALATCCDDSGELEQAFGHCAEDKRARLSRRDECFASIAQLYTRASGKRLTTPSVEAAAGRFPPLRGLRRALRTPRVLRASLRLSKFVPDEFIEPVGPSTNPSPEKQMAPKKGPSAFPGGEGGIRTHGGIATTPVFKTGALNHSATSPFSVSCTSD